MSSNQEDLNPPKPSSEENEEKDYEILKDDYPSYDFSFKVIVIGNSGISNYFLL